MACAHALLSNLKCTHTCSASAATLNVNACLLHSCDSCVHSHHLIFHFSPPLLSPRATHSLKFEHNLAATHGDLNLSSVDFSGVKPHEAVSIGLIIMGFLLHAGCSAISALALHFTGRSFAFLDLLLQPCEVLQGELNPYGCLTVDALEQNFETVEAGPTLATGSDVWRLP